MAADPAHDSLVAQWWEYQRFAAGPRSSRIALGRGDYPSAQRAYDVVEGLVAEGSRQVVDVLRELVESAPAAGSIEIVGAGPLEDLIHEHGDALLTAIEETARRSPAFARALSAVSMESGTLDPRTVDRLSRWVHIG